MTPTTLLRRLAALDAERERVRRELAEAQWVEMKNGEKMMAADTFRTVNDKPIFWIENGMTHRCEGADVHPGIQLIWTDCERDVPANAAVASTGETVDCPRCIAKTAPELLG